MYIIIIIINKSTYSVVNQNDSARVLYFAWFSKKILGVTCPVATPFGNMWVFPE